ncbi:MFS transporter [Halobacteriales archaeon QS_5_70_17]|nr:MAG: MFS transporter [Halobacteriales archaeon QS_5_70_17]
MSGVRSRTVLLSVIACTFFVGFGGGVVFPILPNLEALLGISPFVVGIILSTNRFVRTVANAPAGALVDRFGTRTPFIVGLFVEGVATLGYNVALASSLPEVWFVLARVAWGLGSALVFATAYTITADVSDADSRGTSMGVVRAGITFGFPAGLVLGGVVSDLYGVPAAFSLAAAFALAASGLAFLTVPETHVTEPRGAIAPWEIDRSVPALTAGLVSFGLYFTYLGVLFTTLVLFLGDRGITAFGYSPRGTSGFLMAGTVLAGSGAMLAGGVLSDRLGVRMPVLLGSLSVASAGFLVLAGAGSRVGVLGGCLLVGAGQGGVGGPLLALLADLTPGDRMGRATGTNNVLGDIGSGLGPLVALPAVDAVGFAPVYAACAALPMAAGVALLVGTYRHTGKLNPEVGDAGAG